MICPSSSSKSIQSICVRFVIISPASISDKRKTRSTSLGSSLSKAPDSAPCSNSKRISSAVTGNTSGLSAPIIFVTKDVDADRIQTKGVHILENHTIGLAKRQAVFSGLSIAIRLGTNSPRIKVKYVITTTMVTMLIV